MGIKSNKSANANGTFISDKKRQEAISLKEAQAAKQSPRYECEEE
jgi:hypothetical protein